MFWHWRAPVLGLALLLCSAAHAFTFSYGSWFDVKDVKNENGVLLMPLSGGKYKNVKVLDKDVYRFLQQCKKDCRYDAPQAQFTSVDYRTALTNEHMLIADVDFNGQIALTFLVFKNKKGFWVKTPDEAIFKDRKLEERVKAYLTRLAEKTL